MSTYNASLIVTNSRETEVFFFVEPWGNRHQMAPHANFIVKASSSVDGMLQIEYTEDTITVYGWEGSIVTLFDQESGVVLDDYSEHPVPPIFHDSPYHLLLKSRERKI